jgi:hypothetical protein
MRFFWKNRKKDNFEYEFLILASIAQRLPAQYVFLKEQINKDFILSTMDDNSRQFWRRIVYNEKLFAKYEVKGYNFLLKGISVWDKKSSVFVPIELDFYEGVLIGFMVGSVSDQLDLEHMDVNSISRKFYTEDDGALVFQSVIDLYKKRVAFDAGFIIDLETRRFFTIKDLGDGDYVAIDDSQSVFLLKHDPFEIKLLDNSLDSFVSKLEKKGSNLDQYFDELKD